VDRSEERTRDEAGVNPTPGTILELARRFDEQVDRLQNQITALDRRLEAHDNQFDAEKEKRRDIGRRVNLFVDREFEAANWSQRLTWITVGVSAVSTLSGWALLAVWWWLRR
jgi:hypothetical protein